MLKPLVVVGARPNFVKVAALMRAMRRTDAFRPVLVHTGQHFDDGMSRSFFRDLELDDPDFNLEVGAGTRNWQLATIIQRLEPIYTEANVDGTIVIGDVTSTVAAAMASAAHELPIAHVEAGLRSRNRAMPEELNRIVTDHLSDWLFTPSADADENLAHEGIGPDRIVRVGNIVIDSLLWMSRRISSAEYCFRWGLTPNEFGIVTLHRPSNVDDPQTLAGILGALTRIGDELPLLFAVHPRTEEKLLPSLPHLARHGIRVTGPLPYPDFVGLMAGAALVLTDSGGIQEEAMVLGTRCLTLREETERPITLSGSNHLVGTRTESILEAARKGLEAGSPAPSQPPLWDGRAAERVLEALSLGTAAR